MAAGTFDFTGDNRLEQGSFFTLKFLYRDANDALVDLAGYAVRMQVRSSPRSPAVLLELTTENGGFAVTGLGELTMVVSEAVAETMSWRRGVYGIELTPPGGQGVRWLEGDMEVSPATVRPPA